MTNGKALALKIMLLAIVFVRKRASATRWPSHWPMPTLHVVIANRT